MRSRCWPAVVLAILLAACGDDAEPAPEAAPTSLPEATSVSPTPSPSPSPERDPRPRTPSQAGLDGTYLVKYTTVHSTVSNPDRRQVSNWTMTPNCARPPCTTRIKSTAKWTARAAFVHGRYRWTRVVRAFYYCDAGGDPTEIDASGEYVIKPTAIKYVDGEWRVSRFTGEATFRGHESGGCIPLPEERIVISGVLQT